MSSGSDDLDDEELDVISRARLGRTLDDKWTLEELLGVGGMAAVYGARHRNGKTVAIKMLHSQLASSPSIRKRFLREGHVANRVGHPNAVSVLDDGITADGEAFLVMERLDGETLGARQEREGKLAPGQAARICAEVLAVLSAAHAKSVIHRDIKPENIFLLRDGCVKVLDFGIASVRDATAGHTLATRPGSTRGTPAFMAPEQARGGAAVDARTDVWAVGAMLFTLLTGDTVHRGESVMQMMFLAGTQAARPVESVAPGVPAALAAIVNRALAFDPEARWQDADAMRRALEELGGAPVPVRGAGSIASDRTVPEVAATQLVSRPRARAGGWIGWAIGGSALIVGAWLLLHPRPTATSAPTVPSAEREASTPPAPPIGTPLAPSAIPVVAPVTLSSTSDTAPSRTPKAPVRPPAPSSPPAAVSSGAGPRDIFERRRLSVDAFPQSRLPRGFPMRSFSLLVLSLAASGCGALLSLDTGETHSNQGAGGTTTAGGAGVGGTTGGGGSSGKGGAAASAGSGGSATAGAGGLGGGGNSGTLGKGGSAGKGGTGGTSTSDGGGGIGGGGGSGGFGIGGSGGSAGGSCGDGVKEGAESCDGSDLGGATCAMVVGKGSIGTLACAPGCVFDAKGCSQKSPCGNGKKDAGEACDGTDLGGATCASAVGAGSTGALGCQTDCNLDASGCSAVGPTSPSCMGLLPTCGPTQGGDCCEAKPVAGGAPFHLGRKSGDSDYSPSLLQVSAEETPSVVATVSTFNLDTYEVTVGRFRKFVAAYDAWRAAGNPVAGAGKHTHLAGGAGLNGGSEPGWNKPSWDSQLPTTSSAWGDGSHLLCDPTFQTWTPVAAGGNESRPINCLSWFEAYAFCAWDGGFLATEAEWEYAASGGEERVFPWSPTSNPGEVTVDDTYASHYVDSSKQCFGDEVSGCSLTDLIVVGTKPKGNAKWGHADMGGNVYEWVLDWFAAPYATNPCNDCTNTDATSAKRVIRGGGFSHGATNLRAAYRLVYAPTERSFLIGVRCARPQ